MRVGLALHHGMHGTDVDVLCIPARDPSLDLANRLLIDPTDADRVYLATEGGFFRSANGVWLTEHVPPLYIDVPG